MQRLRFFIVASFPRFLFLSVLLLCQSLTGTSAMAQSAAFRQAVAEGAADNDAAAGFYRDNGYQAIWTDADDAARRAALLTTLSKASDHALPVSRYDPSDLVATLRAAQSERDRGQAEVAFTLAFLAYSHDVASGALEPKKVDAGIVREVAVRDGRNTLDVFMASDPMEFLRALPPDAPEYAALMREKLLMEGRIALGGWGPTISGAPLTPGLSGPEVVALRDRLIAMGYMRPTASADYDAALERAVLRFQLRHGLPADGVAGETTVHEINVAPEDRLKSIVVAMERQRWMGDNLGARYVWVNQTDFTARIVDLGKVTFQSRVVIGKNDPDRRSPEFSDQMEFMVINPSWNVPRSITTKEYLPLLKSNPNAAGHLKIVDSAGRVVSRGAIDFTRYTAANFPFSMRQPPSDGNALGKVKFMFPNPYNIYLHDTPQKALFDQDIRAYSHGCIRLGDPMGFAFALLAVQTTDPEGVFNAQLKTGVESVIKLTTPIPVHLVYFTAYPTPRGEMDYRRDVYGRDERIFDALSAAGVVLPAVQG